jgi:cell division septation protein DedD
VVAVPVEVAAAAPPPSPPAPVVTPSPRSAPPVIVAADPIAAAPVRSIAPGWPAPPAFWVQVGAFQDVERAIGVATALRDHAISIVTAPDQPLMRVLIGPFTERAAAAAKLREIRARGYDAFIAEAQK